MYICIVEEKKPYENNVLAPNFMVLNVGHTMVHHHWGYKDLSSPFVRIFYVVNGRATLHLPHTDVVLTPGHMYLVSTFVPHSYECEPGFEFYYLFVFERFNNQADIFADREYPIEVRANEAADLMFRNFCLLYPELSLPDKNAYAFYNHQSYKHYADSYAAMQSYEHLQLQGLVWIIFSYFMKHSRPKADVVDDRMTRIVKYVQQHLSEETCIDSLADIACVTKSQLTRLFHQTLGVTPLQYVIRKKIQHAQELLLTTDLSVQQVAQRVGFADASYFIRLFKKNIGYTPQDYRRKFR